MAHDPHGNRLKEFEGPPVDVILYGQKNVLASDFAQLLADMGHSVEVRNTKDGNFIPLAKEVVKAEAPNSRKTI